VSVNSANASSQAIVQSVVWRRASSSPALRDLVQKTGTDRDWQLAARDVDRICDLLSDEFVISGLKSDSEPNEWGLQLESAIDWIRRIGQVKDDPGAGSIHPS